jgi:hypothetical protein
VQHILAFTVLAALAVAAYPKARLLLIGVSLSVVGAAIELLQLIPSLHREGSFVDWFADCGAVALVLVLVAGARRFAQGQQEG